MKKMLLGSTTAVLVAAAGVGTPHYLGTQAKQSLEIQHRILAETFLFEVVSHEYEQGWLESTEKTVLRFHPQVLSNLGKQLPDNLRAVLSKPITMINHVHHHPFADGAKPVRAVVETEFVYDDEVQKTLARFFGEQKPLRIRNVIALDGSGAMEIQIAPFEYEELSGIKLDWRGLSGQVKYANAFAHYTTEFKAPLFKAVLADKGSLQLENWQLVSESYSASNPQIALGSSQTQLARAEFVWKDKVNYNLKINELINMVSDLQIGAFINPNGTVTPDKIVVENVQYNTKTSEPTQGFINSEGQFRFDKLHYGADTYGPLNIYIAAEHLHADSLNALKKRWQAITAEALPEEKQREAALAAVRQEGLGIFTNNPVFQVREFDLTTPNGRFRATGSLQLNQLVQSDLNSLPAFMAKLKAQLNLDVSQKLIENFAVQQTRSLFTVEDPTNQQEQQEIADTIRVLTRQTLDTMTQEGYITRENGMVQTQLNIADNRIQLNGKAFQAPSDEDLFAGLEDGPASAPHASAASGH